ncbi:hypothetical protein [Streptomyces sp. AC558_RSS880]|uniref:hypothetical protein n=1 Tax=Streptomyces sp. AC558_RSS880 TaxID=2823687 RepID=UPI001C24D9B5|nr:hypothetical protein [Streptomyces sp. AC558_RSS880]
MRLVPGEPVVEVLDLLVGGERPVEVDRDGERGVPAAGALPGDEPSAPTSPRPRLATSTKTYPAFRAAPTLLVELP